MNLSNKMNYRALIMILFLVLMEKINIVKDACTRILYCKIKLNTILAAMEEESRKGRKGKNKAGGNLTELSAVHVEDHQLRAVHVDDHRLSAVHTM